MVKGFLSFAEERHMEDDTFGAAKVRKPQRELSRSVRVSIKWVLLPDEVAKLGFNGEWISPFYATEGMEPLIVRGPRAPMARFKAEAVSLSAVQRIGFATQAHYGGALPHTAALHVCKLH